MNQNNPQTIDQKGRLDIQPIIRRLFNARQSNPFDLSDFEIDVRNLDHCELLRNAPHDLQCLVSEVMALRIAVVLKDEQIRNMKSQASGK